MYRSFLTVLAVIIILLGASAANAQERTPEELMDSLRTSLRTTRTPSDSVTTLFNMLDLTQNTAQRAAIARAIYRTAVHAGDTLAQIEAIMHRANCRQTDTLGLDTLHQLILQYPSTPRTDEIRLFIELFQIENLINNDHSEHRVSSVSRLIQEFDAAPSDDPAERVKVLFAVCTHLAKSTQGVLLESYTTKLLKTAQEANFPVGAVRNLIYTRSAPLFTNNGNPEAAVAIDKETLNIIDSLSISYRDRGRIYRSLDRNRYQCYRRMLANYKVLTPAEIHQYYYSILDIARRNKAVKADLENNYRTKVYFNMAVKNYPEAIAGIKKALETETRENYRYYLLTALQEAAEATDREPELIMALSELNTILRSEIENKAHESFRELQIKYDVNMLRAENAELEAGRLMAKAKADQVILFISIGAFILLLVMVIVLLRQNRQVKRLANRLRDTAHHLRDERNELQETQKELIAARDKAKSADNLKTDFINTMSHEMKTPLAAIAEYSRVIVDCIPDDKRKYLERFANIIELNSNMVQTLMSDVLDVSTLESDTMSIKKEPVEIYRICNSAIDTVFESGKPAKPGIEMVFNPADRPDAVIITDGRRVAQVLINLLSNANKFTERGSITLDFDVSTKGDKVSFIVTDTGIGIPGGMEEAIFERFEKLNPGSEGTGLGLYICKLIATVLGGTIRVDKDYDRGARFIFTIPTE